MTRLRTLLALACLAFALGVAPAIAQESPPGGTPAVVVEEVGAAEPAWSSGSWSCSPPPAARPGHRRDRYGARFVAPRGGEPIHWPLAARTAGHGGHPSSRAPHHFAVGTIA
jgi:hypothetical protein